MTERIKTLSFTLATGAALLLAVPAAADHHGRHGERERGHQAMTIACS